MKITALTFNIRNDDDINGHSVAERAPRLKKIIDELDPDVIGLQEYRDIWEPYLENICGMKYSCYNKNRSSVFPESAPMLWKKEKFAEIKRGSFWFSDTPEEESLGWDELFHMHRMCSYVVLENIADGTRFNFMNTHYGFGDYGQIRSDYLIKEYADKISDYPTFITGDFNMEIDSLGYRIMTSMFTDANAATVNYLGPTYHGYDPEKNGEHIDYCFVDSKTRPIMCKLIDDTFDGKYPSDHYGLYFELEI